MERQKVKLDTPLLFFDNPGNSSPMMMTSSPGTIQPRFRVAQ
jgi:hypothetical protein